MNKRYFLSLAATLLLTAPVWSTEWHVLGSRAMGMGGTGVAASEGPIGVYWNPASLGSAKSPSGAQVPAGAHAEITGQMLEGANDLNDISEACKDTPGGGICQQPNINAALAKLNRADNGLRVDAGLGAQVKLKRFALFVNNLNYIGAIPKADLANINPMTFATANNSKLTLRGLSVTEIGVGHGRELPFLPGLYAGAALKLLAGKAGYYDLMLNTTEPDFGNAFEKYQNGAKSSVAPGLDLGVLWDIQRTFGVVPARPRVGLSARNINNPKFDNPAQATAAGERARYPLQSNLRLGAAASPLGFITVAADADLTRNLTPVDGVASQNVGLGAEINVFNRSWLNLPLRAGLTRNIALAGSKTAYTMGFGFNLMHFTADLAAMVSPATQQIKSEEENKKIPANLAVSAQIGLVFGGGNKAKEEKVD
ncbi:MAG: conjugal transfer protein TraF [Elusimicrobia bacterium]|nr:conjugal transfer protein TraF [Elusimicrobiota bacterium]